MYHKQDVQNYCFIQSFVSKERGECNKIHILLLDFSYQEREESCTSKFKSSPKGYYFWDPYEPAYMTSEPAYSVDKYARIYFPVTFAVLNSVYWIVYAPDKIIF